MSEHTPGPWYEMTKGNNEYQSAIAQEATGKTVALTYTSNDADARLIAASPDLLRALKDAQLFIHTLLCATPDEALDFLTNNGEQLEHDCRMAMRKANGQEVPA